jgi:hypothetical protein
MSLTKLPNELILLILNNFDNISIKEKYNHPIVTLYSSSKIFGWFTNILISSREETDDDLEYNMFDIFGKRIGIQLSFHYRALCSVEEISGIKYNDIDLIRPFHAYDGHYDEMGYWYIVNNVKGYIDPDELLEAMKDIMNQWKKKDPEHYKWYMRSIEGCNNMLARIKDQINLTGYNFCSVQKLSESMIIDNRN